MIEGWVEWALEGPESLGKPKRGLSGNRVLNRAKEAISGALLDPATTLLPPRYIGLGDRIGTLSASDTALQRVYQYDGASDAKLCSSISTYQSNQVVRFLVQFNAAEGNIPIKQLGLYTHASSADGFLWAKVDVNINKVAGERLTVYWYIHIP